MASMLGVSPKRWPLCLCRRASMTMRCWLLGGLTSCLSVSTLCISGVLRPWETSRKVLRRADTAGTPHSDYSARMALTARCHVAFLTRSPGHQHCPESGPLQPGKRPRTRGHRCCPHPRARQGTLCGRGLPPLWRRLSRYFSLMMSVS